MTTDFRDSMGECLVVCRCVYVWASTLWDPTVPGNRFRSWGCIHWDPTGYRFGSWESTHWDPKVWALQSVILQSGILQSGILQSGILRSPATDF